jgi:catechol 2,3-dioxygenase
MAGSIAPNTTVGTVALTVGDLARSVAYYQNNIGLQLQEQEGEVATLGVDHTPLLRLEELPGAQVIRRATGLYHFALLLTSRLELARTLRQLAETQTPLDGASDHLVSEALYLSDPDGHGIEIYRDRPRTEWYDAQGRFQMDTLRLDLRGLLAELQQDDRSWSGLHPDTLMGHVHLQVADVGAAERFYTDIIGFEHMADYPSASFVSAGGYHHHLGMNSWMGAGAPPPPPTAARLLWYEIRLPDQAALDEVLARLRTANVPVEQTDQGWLTQDPSQNKILLKAG